MPLKFMLDSLEGLDENVAALYSKHDDGKFYLEVDGAVSKNRLDEFRNNNVELLKKLDDFKDIDPEKYTEMVQKMTEIEKKKTIPAEQVDQMVAERVKEMQDETAASVKKYEEQIGTMSRQLEGLVIDSAVRKAATDGKVLASAVDDVLLRAKSVFKVVEGVAVPHDGDNNVIYGKDGTNPMGISEWMGKLAKDASHLFEGSQGGGGGGGNRPGGGQQMDPSKMTAAQKITQGLNDRG